jgi:hypothetical protein
MQATPTKGVEFVKTKEIETMITLDKATLDKLAEVILYKPELKSASGNEAEFGKKFFIEVKAPSKPTFQDVSLNININTEGEDAYFPLHTEPDLVSDHTLKVALDFDERAKVGSVIKFRAQYKYHLPHDDVLILGPDSDSYTVVKASS